MAPTNHHMRRKLIWVRISILSSFEERALEGLSKGIRKHAEGGAVLDHDDAALDEVVEPKVPDADVP